MSPCIAMRFVRPLGRSPWLVLVCWLWRPGVGLGHEEGAEVAAPAVPAALVEMEVHPRQIELHGRFDYHQLLVTGRRTDGSTVDLTRAARREGVDGLVEITPGGVIRPVEDGRSVLRLQGEGLSVEVPVIVSGVRDPVQPSFVRDVMPLLSSLGCNAGTCHGSAKGKNGFKLSLRGYDPLFDHLALTDDLAGRRTNPAAPSRSLFLLKPTAAVPHEGGRRLDETTRDYELLRGWVATGAPMDAAAARAVEIELLPAATTLADAGAEQQMKVIATYADGRRRDVTREAFVETSNTEVASVQPGSLVTGLRRGETTLLARYEGRYSSARLVVMGDREGFEWTAPPEYNTIDTLVYRKLQTVRTSPGVLCTDAEFLRRVTLDLTGRLPTPQETRTFLWDTRDTQRKRHELIERLLGGAEFVDFWTSKWSDLLQVNSKFLGPDGLEAMRTWLRRSIASNEPYDQFVRDILGATGSTLQNPPAAYYKVLREADAVMENTTQLFLGIRFNCNKCHDHPFERWTQAQHWSLAAYFAQVHRENAPGSPMMPQRGGNEPEGAPTAYEEIISDLPEGDLEHPDTGAVVAPDLPYQYGARAEGDTRREVLVEWLTHPDNPYFARSYVNRLWSYFLGVGLIDPVDDIRASNPPSNPALLEFLTTEFIDSGFDVRHMMRTICQSRVYQHSVQTDRWNADDTINYSHALARRLPAEVLFDAVHQAAGSRTHLAGLRPGTRSVAGADPSVKAKDGFLDLFGRPPRESACECERSSGMSLGQALNLINGPTVADAVADPAGRIAELVAYEKDPARIIEEIYLAFLSRDPTEQEVAGFAGSFVVTDPANRAALSPEEERRLEEELTAWQAAQSVPDWQPLAISDARSEQGATLQVDADGAITVTGERPDKDRYTVVGATTLPNVTGLRLELLTIPELESRGPGRADNGNFVLQDLRVVAVPLGEPGGARHWPLQHATATFSQGGFPVAAAIDEDPASGWAVSPEMGKAHEAVFELEEDLTSSTGSVLVLTLDQQYGDFHTLGRFRLWVTSSPRPVRHHGLPDDVLAALQTEPASRSTAQEARIYAHFMGLRPDLGDRIRLGAAQDLAWALANSSAFLFNR